MSDYGLIITLPGHKVEDATPEQCAVHTKFNSPKIDATRDHFVTLRVFFLTEPPDATAGSSLETVIHSDSHVYDYQPQLWTHVEYTSNYNGTTAPQFGPGEAFLASSGIGDDAFIGVRADKSNYYVYVRKHRAINPVVVLGMSVTIRLYLFAETAFE